MTWGCTKSSWRDARNSVSFSASEEENFTYPWAYEVDSDKTAEFDAADMEIADINIKIRDR